MRSFLLFRLACASLNGVVLISGAFGCSSGRLSSRSAGSIARPSARTWTDPAHPAPLSKKRERVRIGFAPLPACLTQAPEDWPSLGAQRCDGAAGCLQVLWRHRGMIGNPRYGIVGVGILPYHRGVRGLRPAHRVLRLSAHGRWPRFSARRLGALPGDAAASILFGIGTSLVAVFLSDVATGRYIA
jgi:hypothetical protein